MKRTETEQQNRKKKLKLKLKICRVYEICKQQQSIGCVCLCVRERANILKTKYKRRTLLPSEARTNTLGTYSNENEIRLHAALITVR